MGFAWSSFVAQETLLAIAGDAGLDDNVVVAPDVPLPDDLDIAFSLATDDLMFFSDGGPGRTTAVVQRFEAALLAHGACKHPGKDVDDETSALCVGIELVDGAEWWPPGNKMCQLFHAIVDLSRCRCGSPAGIACYMGTTQWYNLLCRLKLSAFNRVYAFAADYKNWKRSSVAPLPAAEVRRIALLSSKNGDHLVLGGAVAGDRAPRGRLGRPHQLGLTLADFEVVLSVKVSEPAHINLEEARALLRYVRWLLRSVDRFEHRVVVLVDSRVVVGACTKGRSSSVPLNRLVQRLAALCFAGGLSLYLVYIPSAHNPSDPPSRGPRETWPWALRAATRQGVVGGTRRARREAARQWHNAAEARTIQRGLSRACAAFGVGPTAP